MFQQAHPGTKLLPINLTPGGGGHGEAGDGSAWVAVRKGQCIGLSRKKGAQRPGALLNGVVVDPDLFR